jgi:hypothetical protein
VNAPRFSPRRVFAATLLGVLLVQAAWILTLPAFRGSDEFDHVYKAASVARGQWTARVPADNGVGGIVKVPESIVRAAASVCDRYPYTGHDNCNPIRSVGHGDVEVATTASAYNPAYYLVVGTLSRPFGGAGADYAIRVVSAIACALLIAWAAAITARWATTGWPLLTLVTGLTPVLLYSTATAAPNGATLASAALVWSSLTAIAREPGTSPRLAVPLTIGSITMVATHTSGAMWLGLALAVVLLLRPVASWTRLLRTHWLTWASTAVVVGAGTAVCLEWIRFAHANTLSGPAATNDPFPWDRLPSSQIAWTFQAIAAFPLRNEPAPAPVYILWGVPLAVLLVTLLRRARARERVAVGAIVLILLVVPTVLSVLAFPTQGMAWQGRYSLPLWLGITSIGGMVLDRRGEEPRRAVRRGLLVLLATATTISTLHVGMNEVAHGTSDPVAAGIPGGFLLVGLLTALGVLVGMAPLEWGAVRGAQDQPHGTPAAEILR